MPATVTRLDDILGKLLMWARLPAESRTAASFRSAVGVEPDHAARLVASAASVALARGQTTSVVDFLHEKRIPGGLVEELKKLAHAR